MNCEKCHWLWKDKYVSPDSLALQLIAWLILVRIYCFQQQEKKERKKKLWSTLDTTTRQRTDNVSESVCHYLAAKETEIPLRSVWVRS